MKQELDRLAKITNLKYGFGSFVVTNKPQFSRVGSTNSVEMKYDTFYFNPKPIHTRNLFQEILASIIEDDYLKMDINYLEAESHDGLPDLLHQMKIDIMYRSDCNTADICWIMSDMTYRRLEIELGKQIGSYITHGNDRNIFGSNVETFPDRNYEYFGKVCVGDFRNNYYAAFTECGNYPMNNAIEFSGVITNKESFLHANLEKLLV